MRAVTRTARIFLLLYENVEHFAALFVKLCEIGYLIAIVVSVAEDNSVIIKIFYLLMNVIYLKNSVTACGFNVENEACDHILDGVYAEYLGNVIELVKAIGYKLSAVIAKIVEMLYYGALLLVVVNHCYVRVLTCNGEHISRFESAELGAVLKRDVNCGRACEREYSVFAC